MEWKLPAMPLALPGSPSLVAFHMMTPAPAAAVIYTIPTGDVTNGAAEVPGLSKEILGKLGNK